MLIVNANDEADKLDKKITVKSKQIDQFCDEHNLKRDYSREQVT